MERKSIKLSKLVLMPNVKVVPFGDYPEKFYPKEDYCYRTISQLLSSEGSWSSYFEHPGVEVVFLDEEVYVVDRDVSFKEAQEISENNTNTPNIK